MIKLALLVVLVLISNASMADATFWDKRPNNLNTKPTSLATVVEYNATPDIRAIGDGRINKTLTIYIPNTGDVQIPLVNFTPETGFILDEETGSVYIDPRAFDTDISFSWYGSSDMGELSLTVYRGTTTARFSKGKATWIVVDNGPETFLRQIDLSLLPEEPRINTSRRSSTREPQSQPTLNLSPRSVDQISILVLYTSNAVTVAGGQSALDSMIHSSIANLNQAMQNSKVTSVAIENALASTGQAGLSVNYNEISTTNSQCTGSCNFLFHRKHARSNYSSLRNTYNADIVVLLVGDTTSCGVAYTQRDQCGIDTDELNCSVGAGYNAFAYSVVSSNPACPVGDYSFVHEVGHQFGLEHDRTEPYTEDPSFYWSFGYAIYAPPIADRDVMARASNCLGCASTLLYSTPQVNFPSGATAGTFNIDGNGRAAWNARTVAALASTMSGFRGAAVTDRVFRSAFEDLPLP